MFKTNVGSIDDLNFNDSLDALLNSENLNDVSNPLQEGVMVPDTIGLQSSQVPPQQLPGLMTAEPSQGMIGITGDHNMVFPPLPNIQYTVPARSQRSTTSSVSSYATNTYPQQVSIAPTMASLASLQHQPIVPAPPSGRPSTEVKPMIASSSTTTSCRLKGAGGTTEENAKRNLSSKRFRDATAVSEDEEDRVKRRQGRNLREQQRSQKITNQIDTLKEVLASANITFKPDKYSTLVTVADYIKQLQAKSAALDAEHKKLIDTISRTNEMVNDQYVPASTDGQHPPGCMQLGGVETGDDSSAVLVPNIDYRSVFASCGAPLAVASIDGRLLDCNVEFQNLTGYTREELLPCESLTVIAEKSPSGSGEHESSATQAAVASTTETRNLSLFNLLSRDHMEGVFLAMSEMLKKPKNDVAKPVPGDDLWFGDVFLGRYPEIKVRVIFLRQDQSHLCRNNKFLNCVFFFFFPDENERCTRSKSTGTSQVFRLLIYSFS
jgi:PAS domain-containing protein